MKTLKEHNDHLLEQKMARLALLVAGVACDRCGAEMRFECQRDKSAGFGRVWCPKCGYGGWLNDE